MQLPETVKVGPYDYRIETVTDLRDADTNRKLYGDWQTSPPRIRVLAAEPDARTLAILLHEVIHVIDEYMVIGLSEKQTNRLGTGLAAFLRDNHLLRQEQPAATRLDGAATDALAPNAS